SAGDAGAYARGAELAGLGPDDGAAGEAAGGGGRAAAERQRLDPADAGAAERAAGTLAAPCPLLAAASARRRWPAAGDARAHAQPPPLPARRDAPRPGQLRRGRGRVPRRSRALLGGA